jgi:hypothetical protein
LLDSTDPDTQAAAYVQAALTGCTITPYINGIAQTAFNLSMAPKRVNETIRRHNFNVNIDGESLSLKISNLTASQKMRLLDCSLELFALRND